jgi:hypothetical protein
VVGRDGRAYDPTDWYRSHTFWEANQENLLIADNQTAEYEHGDQDTRTALSRYAWGHEADLGSSR